MINWIIFWSLITLPLSLILLLASQILNSSRNKKTTVGLIEDEHFGISVVEYMAAGAIPIAHNSAGPKIDIVLDEDEQQTGFLARNIEEYADAIMKIVKMSEPERLKIAASARERANRFSEQIFYDDLKAAIRPIIGHSS